MEKNRDQMTPKELLSRIRDDLFFLISLPTSNLTRLSQDREDILKFVESVSHAANVLENEVKNG